MPDEEISLLLGDNLVCCRTGHVMGSYLSTISCLPPQAPHVWRLKRRAFFTLACAGVFTNNALARDSALPVPASLLEAGQTAQLKRAPLVILVSLPGCPFCELVRRNYLLPMRAQGLQAVQIDVTDRQQNILDFTGKRTSASALAARWDATFTPTVLFFDARGTELAKRIVGVASADFYGSYLDEALLTARGKIGR